MTRDDLRKDFLFLLRLSLPNVMKPNKRLTRPMNKPSKASWFVMTYLSLLRRNNWAAQGAETFTSLDPWAIAKRMVLTKRGILNSLSTN